MTELDPATEAWLASVIERFEGPLIRYAQRITGDHERARDVVQDTFVRLHGHGGQRVASKLAPWLFAVTRNRALDVSKKERRMQHLDTTLATAFDSGTASPASDAERQETLTRVAQTVEGLPAKQREAVMLKFSYGLSYREIATITNHSVSHVGFLIHRGLRSLRLQLSQPSGLTMQA